MSHGPSTGRSHGRADRLRGGLLAGLACAVAACVLLTGCNIASGIFYIVHGPDEKIPPKFVLPPDKSAVVFVDDRNSKLPSRDLREMIATSAGEVLLSEHAVKELIDPRAALGAASKDRFGEPMTIAEIGRAVKADMVVYVTVDSFSLSGDGQSLAPVAALRVKVVESNSEARLWPEEQEGYGLGVQCPPNQGTLSNSASEMYRIRQEAAARTGLGIAQLFTEHIARASAGTGSAATK